VDVLTDASLYSISCDRFRRIVMEHEEVAMAVVRGMAADVRRLTDMVESLALHTVRTRLARFLLAQTNGELPPRRWTQEEIASQIGTVREMVGRTLRDLAADGLIRRQRGQIVVADETGLEREATGA
jgi:CRP/FNR family transcriptional regulator